MRTRHLIVLALVGWFGLRAVLRRRAVTRPPITRQPSTRPPVVDRDPSETWENEGGAVR